MKFAFIIDSSPLMQIKKSVVGEFPLNSTKALAADSKKQEEDSKVDQDKGADGLSDRAKDFSPATGMSFFEQSIYAIEEFIAIRKKLGFAWK